MHLSIPRPPRNPTATLSAIPEGKAGIAETLRQMKKLVQAGKTNLQIRGLAIEICQNEKQKDWVGQLRAIHDYVRDNIGYIKDVRGVETIHTPENVLYYGAGDCDDKSILFCSLAESIGHPTRFVAVGFAPDSFSHVFAESRVGKRWIASDTTENVPLGWRAPNIQSVMICNN